MIGFEKRGRHLPALLDGNEINKYIIGGKSEPHGFSFFTAEKISTTEKVINEKYCPIL